MHRIIETGGTMNSNSGKSLWERIQAWWRRGSGATQEAPAAAESLRERGSAEVRDPDTAVREQSTQATDDVKERVSDINTGLRTQAGKLARPMEEGDVAIAGAAAIDRPDDLAHTIDRPEDMGSDRRGAEPGTSGASADEFAGGGYAPGATSPADVAAAADDTVTPEPAEAAENAGVGIPPDSDVGGTGEDAQTTEFAAGSSTYATRVDDVTSGQDAPERAEDTRATGATWGAETAEALEDAPAETGLDEDDFLEAGMTGADTADAGQPVGQGVTFDPGEVGSDESPVYDEAAMGSGTIRPAVSAALEGEPPPTADVESPAGGGAGGTYAATAGDIASTGSSTGSDLGIGSSADLDASELGSLEDADGAGASAAVPDPVRARRFGDRPGADLSRTGFYAEIRGDADAAPSDDVGTPSADAPAGPSGTPIEESVGKRSAVAAPDGAGNLEATAGDDYSAERSADMAAGTSPESTTTSAIGDEMASGEEADDLVGEPPTESPAPGVAVDMGAETEPEGSGGHPGAVRGDGTADTPPGYPIKGNASSMIYHTPDMPSYRGTKPEWCFATVEDAQAAGFRAPRARNLGGNAGPAATAPAGSAGDTGSGIVDPHVIGRNPEPTDVAPASDMTDSLNRYSDPQVSGGGRLTEEIMDANPAVVDEQFGSGADDIESLQMPSPDDAAATAHDAQTGPDSADRKAPGDSGAA
jgi:hypothetical protein